MADSERKIDAMFGMLHEMKPVLIDVREGQKEMDARVRSVELQVGTHAVKIERIQSDIDGLGKKIRHTTPIVIPARRSDHLGWRSLMEFLSVLPTYWHVILSAGLCFSSFLAILWRRHP